MSVTESPRKLRAATPQEAVLLGDLALRSKGYWGYPAEFLAACRDELSYTPEQIESADTNFVVAELANEPAGFYALQRVSEQCIELLALFVAPEWIGQGVGRRLLAHARTAASSSGASKLRIQGDPNAARFYEAAGARQVGELASGSIPGRMLPLYEIDL